MMAGLPKRDLWLLPLIAVLTVVVLLAGAELVSRLVWPEQVENVCRKDDPVLGYRFAPNCSSVMKAFEGPWYSNHYNECGYRSTASCGPAPAGTRRVVMLGSSLAEGYLVRYEDSMAARLEAELTAACHAPVQMQNLGAVGYFTPVMLPRMTEALRLKPDQVVLVMSPFDLEGVLDYDIAPTDGQPALGPPPPPLAADEGLLRELFAILKLSRALVVAQHFLFQNPAVYLPLYLRYGDKADFLRLPYTEAWRDRMTFLDAFITRLSDQAHRAGVPMLLAFVPQEAEVMLMAGRGKVPAGVDPDALPKAVAALAARHGVAFADTSERLRINLRPERLYYQVDGHLGGPGQRLAADHIADRLTAIPGGPFANCRRGQPRPEPRS